MNIYGILAYPAKHSLSPIIHNTGFEFLGIDAKYEIFEIEPENLDNFMKKIKQKGICGLSVSMPYKQEIIKYLDEIDEISKKLNSVNTVYLKEGKLYGTNTDVYGILIPLLNEIYGDSIELMDLNSGSFKFDNLGNQNKYKIAILGAGGAANAACFAAKYISNDISIFNRTIEKAKDLGSKFDIKAFSLDKFDSKKFDIILQMTSVGMLKSGKVEKLKSGKVVAMDQEIVCVKKGKDLKLEKLQIINYEFNPNQICFESVYYPIDTNFVKLAKKAGSKVITGENMLLYQALKQFTIWTGRKAPIIAMHNALLKDIKN